MNIILSTIVNSLLEGLATFSATATRKLSLALSQLDKAGSVEEYQQIGIIVRDAWIEFAQSIFRPDMLGQDMPAPSNSDAKRLVECALKYHTSDYEYLLTSMKDSYDLANSIQHDTNAKKVSVVQLLSMASLCMALILDAITQSPLFRDRPYYKCPICGSLKLEMQKKWEPDFDGAFEVDVLVCADCGWYYIEELGGMSGIDQE